MPSEEVAVGDNAASSRVPTASLGLGVVELREIIGEGASAVVYTAVIEDVSLAIKVLRPELSVHPDVLSRFSLEIETMCALLHPAIPVCYGSGTTSDGLPFAAFSRITGETLRARMDRGAPLSVVDGLTVLDDLLDVLRVAHERGVIHRDIKPSNVMLAEDGSTYLLDFGLAHLLDQTEDLRVTGRGVPIGTPAYMPPEMARADRERTGPASDLFSAAMTVASAIGGRTLREATDPFAMLIEASQPPLPLRAYAVEMPVPLEELLDRAMAERPEDRFASAEAMQEATRLVARSLGASLPRRRLASDAVGARRSEPAARMASHEAEQRHAVTVRPARPPGKEPWFRGHRFALVCALGLAVAFWLLAASTR